MHLLSSDEMTMGFLSFQSENDSKTFIPQLEPLGVNTELDKTKLVQSKKAGERKAVKKAYEEVML